ncbi:UBX domain-containing protein [Klebsormidium nitens]|uniref:UBX domain-containing protein n=1 Tax=Klebsormidium nitens TaxID=105231 RepID=A0A1Y1HNX7_KLENI|nr:UBX domain-containing protein [Klebsormidium nitens]|eukprot:GAQ78899.1 UBX domain-containing protein [Klebsormidium nitens]
MAASEGGGSDMQQVFYQGSITEAIGKAKVENKQVVVYVGSENAESKEMEAVTWPAIADSLKGMLILRLQEGSPDAANFSAFCKINKAPTVAVIGTAGDCVFWHEGFISSADLVKGIEEGALKSQLARAMAAMLTNAAGATAPTTVPGPAQNEEPRHNEQQRSVLRVPQGRGDAAGGVQGPVPLGRAPMPAQSEERQVEGARPSVGARAAGRAGQEADAEMQYGWTVTFTHRERMDDPGLETVDDGSESEERIPDLLDESGHPVLDDPPGVVGTAPEHQTAGGSLGPGGVLSARASAGGAKLDKKEGEAGGSASVEAARREAESTVKKQKRDQEKPPPPSPSKPPIRPPTQAPPAAPKSIQKPVPAVPSTASAESRQAGIKASPKPAPPPASTSQTAVIQFRLTNGESMRAEFDKNAPLWDARAWLDANRNENGSPYDLAIPFPKRILTESDLEKSFVELQLYPRASLLLIPKRFSNVSARPAPSGPSEEQGVVAGVTRTVGGVLGYLNPLAYLWGPAAPPAEAAAQPAGRPWEYGPNPQLERAVREGGAGPAGAQEPPSRGLGSGGRFATPNSNQTGSSDQTRKRGAGARGNIHGLDRSSEEEADPRRNNFWNGNSTQFGSDDKDQ